MGFPGGSVKNLPAMQETQLRSLGQEDPLEKGMSTHSRILAWRTPFAEDPGGLQSMGLPKLDMTEQLSHTHTHTQISDLMQFSLLQFPRILLLLFRL